MVSDTNKVVKLAPISDLSSLISDECESTVKVQGDNIAKSYGAMTETLHFLSPLEQLRLQALSKWMYRAGVGRVQTRCQLPPKIFYFVNLKSRKIAAYSHPRGLWHTSCEDGSVETNQCQWFSCQVGRHRLFQVLNNCE